MFQSQIAVDMQPDTQGLLSGKKFTIKINKGDKSLGYIMIVTQCYNVEVADVKGVTWLLGVPGYMDLKPGTWGIWFEKFLCYDLQKSQVVLIYNQALGEYGLKFS